MPKRVLDMTIPELEAHISTLSTALLDAVKRGTPRQFIARELSAAKQVHADLTRKQARIARWHKRYPAKRTTA